MDVQTTDVKPDPASVASPGLARSVGELGADILSLAELQAKLGWEDFKSASRRATAGFAISLVAAGCAVGGMPILLLGLAEVLVEVFGWQRWIAYVVFGAIAVVGSTTLALFGARLIFRNFTVFRRSRDELLKNLEWLKQVSKQTAATWKESGPK